jgi:hypothetical protein
MPDPDALCRELVDELVTKIRENVSLAPDAGAV